MRPFVASSVIALGALMGARSNAQQRVSPVAIHAEETATAALELDLQEGRNTALALYLVDGAASDSWTVQVGSPDFLPRIQIGAGEGMRSSRHSSFTGYSVAWITLDSQDLRAPFAIGSEDARGGEFAITLHLGRRVFDDDRTAQMRALVESSDVLAEQAARRSDRERSARLRDKASRAALAMGDAPTARRLAELQTRDAEVGSLPEQSVRAGINLGAAEFRLGNSIRAEEILGSTLPAAERLLASRVGSPSEREWAALLCFLHDTLGDLRSQFRSACDALPSYRRAAEIAPRSSRSDATPIALSKLASTLDDVGETAEARGAVLRALAAAERPGTKPPTLAGVLSSYAQHLIREGDYAGAQESCERGLGLDPPTEYRVALLGVLADAWLELGRYERAQGSIDELEALVELGSITEYEIPIRIHRASLALRLGNVARAREQLEGALRCEERSGSNRDHVAILLDLALVREQDGETVQALAEYEQALQTCKDRGDFLQEARLLLDMASLQEGLGDHEAALRSLGRSGDVASDAGDRRGEALARGGKGYVLFRKGELDAARELAAGAARDLTRLDAQEAAVDAQETLAQVGLAAHDAGAVEAALLAAEGFLEGRTVQSMERFTSLGLRSRFAGGEFDGADWSAIEQDLVACKLGEASSDEDREAAISVGWRRAQRWKARMLLARMPEDLGTTSRKNAGVRSDAKRPRVSGGSAILEYVNGSEQLYAYVADPGGVHFVALGPRGPIESAAREFVAGIASRAATPQEVAERAVRLHERILAPLIAKLPRGTARLSIVPTADLASVPFEALVPKLPTTQAGELRFEDLSFLTDTYQITFAPSAAVLARLQEKAPRTGPRRFLVLGDPVYRPERQTQEGTLAAAAESRSLIDLERLPATREEIREIAQLLLFQDTTATEEELRKLLEVAYRRSASLSTKLFDLHVGVDASLGSLSTDLAAYTNLHFAVHGHVDAHDYRHSGLVLSWEPASEGLLTFEDLLTLRLDADLVVLSACDTAAGPIVRGEGIQSLANAFLESGARSVIASLWRVADTEAAEIMKTLYRVHLDGKVEPAEALRRAKMEFRRSRRPRGESPGQGPPSTSAHPYYWSAFVFIGAPPP